MDISPLQHHDGGNAASALENLAHRLVATHQPKTSATTNGWTVEDVIDVPLFDADEFGLDRPATPSASANFLDRIRHFFHS